MKRINLRGITLSTWSRLVLLFSIVAYLVSYALGFRIPVGELIDEASKLLIALGTCWLAWKNLSITDEAQAADERMRDYKESSYLMEIDDMGADEDEH